MKRKPLIPLYKAKQLYGYKPVPRPQYVPDGMCQWCGQVIKGKRRKTFCSLKCSNDYYRLVALGRTRGGYSNQIVWRDNCTCQDCGEFLAVKNCHGIYIPLERGAEVHHIIPVKDGGDDNPNNLITLCHDCHKERHKRSENNSKNTGRLLRK